MRILLGVSGSISAYKALDLARLWVKAGHEVKVILTKGAEQFVVPQVFRYLGVSEVYSHNDDFNEKQYQDKNLSVLHIDLARWCDRLVVAPLSANTLSILAQAMAPDLLSSVFLALGEKPVVIFPAMNI